MADLPVADEPSSHSDADKPAATDSTGNAARQTVRAEDHLLGLGGGRGRRRRRPVITLTHEQVDRELRLVRVTSLLALIWAAWTIIAAFLALADEPLRMRIAANWLPPGLVEAIHPTGLAILVCVLALTAGTLYLWGALRLMRLDRVARWVLMGLSWILLLNIGARLLDASHEPAWEIMLWEILTAVAMITILQRRPMAELMMLAALTRRRLALEAAVKLARNETAGPSEISDQRALVEALMRTAKRYRPAPEGPKPGLRAAIAAARQAAAQQPAESAAPFAPPPPKAPEQPALAAEQIATVTPYPLLVESRLIPTAWGGTGLRWLGEEVPDGERVGYAEQVGANVRIRNGALAGHTLATVARHWGPWLLGPAALDTPEPQLPLEVTFLATARATPVLAIPPRHPEQGRELVIAWVLLHGPTDALIRSGIVRPGVDGVVAHPVQPGAVVKGYVGEPYTIGPNLVCYQVRTQGPEPTEVKPAELTPLPEHQPPTDTATSAEVGKPLEIEGVEAETLIDEGPRMRLKRVVLAQPTSTAKLKGDSITILHHVGGRPVRLDWAGGTEWLRFGTGLILPAALTYHEATLTAPHDPQTETQPATLLLATPN